MYANVSWNRSLWFSRSNYVSTGAAKYAIKLSCRICGMTWYLHYKKWGIFHTKKLKKNSFDGKKALENGGKINVTKKCPAFNHVHFYGFDKHLLLYKYLKNCFVIWPRAALYFVKNIKKEREIRRELYIPTFFRLSFGPEMFYRLFFPLEDSCGLLFWSSAAPGKARLCKQAHDSFQALLHRVCQN